MHIQRVMLYIVVYEYYSRLEGERHKQLDLPLAFCSAVEDSMRENLLRVL